MENLECFYDKNEDLRQLSIVGSYDTSGKKFVLLALYLRKSYKLPLSVGSTVDYIDLLHFYILIT